MSLVFPYAGTAALKKPDARDKDDALNSRADSRVEERS